MDIAIDYCDEFYLDEVYGKYFPSEFTDRTYFLRQYLTVLVIWTIGGWFFYLSTAGLSYQFFFDKSLKNHKLYLPNQVQQEIQVAMTSIPIMAIPSALIFVFELRGYSRMYSTIDGPAGWIFVAISIPFYLMFTDALIYWIHRILHHPVLYGPIHKLHHKWVISTPFASHAFHPLDGFLQSTPYHIYVFIFPFNKVVYLLLFIFVNVWTVSIHDNLSCYDGIILNGAEHHTIHHRQFNYNYGQYFTFWDRICSTHRMPKKEETKGKSQ